MLTLEQREEWFNDFQETLNNIESGVGELFNGVEGFIHGLNESGFGQNPYVDWTDAGVLQQVQNGLLNYLGQNIVCSGLYDACGESAQLWGNVIEMAVENGAANNEFIALYGAAEEAGAHYGMDLAFATLGESGPGANDLRLLMWVADGYRDGQQNQSINTNSILAPSSHELAHSGMNVGYTLFRLLKGLSGLGSGLCC